MKKILLLSAVMLLGLTTSAQETEEIQTLFGGGTRISGFGGPFMTFGTINSDFAHMMGGGGGVILGNYFLGGYGLGLTNYIDAGGTRMGFGHGGFWTGYSFFGNRAVHPAVSTLIGWGGLTMEDGLNPPYQSDNVFVVSPVIELEMNFLRFFRMCVGANYTFVTGVNTPGLTDGDFNSPGAFISFKFGWF